MLPEFPVIFPDFLMIDNEDGSPVLAGKDLQEFEACLADMVDGSVSSVPFFFRLFLVSTAVFVII